MRQRIQIWNQEDYHYQGAGLFIPFMVADIHEDEDIHPAMIVAPGGGFIQLSPQEASGVAKQFYERGYNTFVLMYTNNVTLEIPMVHQALKDISRAIQIIRSDCRKYHVNPNMIIGCGFSGGGYMVAALAILHEREELHLQDSYADVSNRLDGAILNYALITGGKYSAPELGFKTLVGENASREEIDKFSLELHVNSNATPMLINHGTADTAVPVQNAHLLADACLNADVPYEVHTFLGCQHGFAVAALPMEWMEESKYVYEQLYYTIQAMSDEEFEKYKELYSPLNKEMTYEEFSDIAAKEVTMKMWNAGLKVDMEKLAQMMAMADGNLKYAQKTNLNAGLWWDMADQWVKTVLSVN